MKLMQNPTQDLEYKHNVARFEMVLKCNARLVSPLYTDGLITSIHKPLNRIGIDIWYVKKSSIVLISIDTPELK